jgi:hypothetical protein
VAKTRGLQVAAAGLALVPMLAAGHHSFNMVAMDRDVTFPVTIELEYAVPDGSTAVAEVVRCLDFCKAALDA